MMPRAGRWVSRIAGALLGTNGAGWIEEENVIRSFLKRRSAGLAAAAWIALGWLAPAASAHNLATIPDYSNTFPTFRTVGAVGIPNGQNGDAGIGFPIDPRDLQDGAGRARVFHEHFEGNTPFENFDGTVVFCVFNGPNYTPCSPAGPILPPLPVTYTNATGDYSVVIDFGRIMQANLGADDLGALTATDWIYAYAVVNDEGETSGVRGSDAIGAIFLSFSSGLRRVAADLPLGSPTFRLGNTISSTGDIEPLVAGPNTTNPQSLEITQAIGTQMIFSQSSGGEGCIPDVTNRLAPPPDCNSGQDACTTNIFYLASPFGPGVSNIAHIGGSGASATDENVVIGPFTYPNVRCNGLTINNVSRPGQPVRAGDMIQLVVDVQNPAPAAGPPYLGINLPGGTQRGTAIVSISTMGGTINGLGGPQTVCTEIAAPGSRNAQATFNGTFVGPGTTVVTASVAVPAPYNTGPNPPFDSTEAGYIGRFPVVLSSVNCQRTITVPPMIEVDKGVQFVCFTNPNNPNQFELRPATPVKDVDAPVCGLVRFTIRVTNPSGETLNNVRVSDCLPNDLLFRNNTIPATPLGVAGEGPGCGGLAGVSEIVFRIPNLNAGASYTFTFDAIVRSASPSGIKTNTARARGRGATSGEDTNVAESVARVNVRTIAATMVARGASPDPICVGQTATFNFRFTNTGQWPLNPAIANRCLADAGLMILSQNPVEGTNLGPVAPTAFRDISVTARAVAGGAASRCITCGVTAFPDCFDPRDTEICRLTPDARQCVTVITTGIDVICQTPTQDREPGEQVTLTFRIVNTGDVRCDNVSIMCDADPGLTVLDCPPNFGPLNPTQFVDVNVLVQIGAGASGTPCVRLTATCSVNGQPPECAATDSDRCCVSLERRVPTLGGFGLLALALLLGLAMLRRFSLA